MPCSGSLTLSSSGVHLRPKSNVSSHKKSIEEVKFLGVRGVRKHRKIKVNHQMDDVISLDSSSQATIFKQKDCVKKLARNANVALTLVATGNCAAIYDAKSPVLKAIKGSNKII